jgi:hypothetical protein
MKATLNQYESVVKYLVLITHLGAKASYIHNPSMDKTFLAQMTMWHSSDEKKYLETLNVCIGLFTVYGNAQSY